jgi:hypothetical protein
VNIVIDICASLKANRVLGDILSGFGVVVAEAVVVKARFNIFILALITEGAVLRLSSTLAYLSIGVEGHVPGGLALRILQG